jgi:hypothetical protein
MKNKKSHYRHIKSFKDLEEEKLRLFYQVRYSEKKLQLKMLEMGYFLHPARLVPSLISEWTRPLLLELRLRIRDFFFRKKERTDPIKQD